MPAASALPTPDPEALAHSATLVRRIGEEIAAQGGWIPFARYMELALYAPGLGYYVSGSRKFGAAGDFITAPELSPLFAQCLVEAALPALAGEADILELGAGSGALAAALLAALAERGALPGRYRILEVSPELAARQCANLARQAPNWLNRVEWIDRLPDAMSGVVLANEVLDALPVHLVRWQAGEIFERGVIWTPEGFAWQDRPLSGGALRHAAEALEIDAGDGDYLSEINLAAPALVRSLGERLRQGLMLCIDYGHARAEYYHPGRTGGTLMGHYRHHALTDPFFLPGLVDLTAHVDFTAIAEAALDTGLDVLGYTTQAHFLIDCGLLERLRGVDTGALEGARAMHAAQRLIQPGEMGDRFKAMALGRGIEPPLPGFRRGDRRHVL